VIPDFKIRLKNLNGQGIALKPILKPESKMKLNTMIKAASTLALCAGLLAATAQSAVAADDSQLSTQVTRAQVRHHLAALESVGYDWAANDNYYPQNLQAAEQRLADRKAQRQAGALAQNSQ
jgi:Domain of unknown function (DUF4148)